MSITIKRDIDDFSELRDLTWECDFTLNAIENADMEENESAQLYDAMNKYLIKETGEKYGQGK